VCSCMYIHLCALHARVSQWISGTCPSTMLATAMLAMMGPQGHGVTKAGKAIALAHTMSCIFYK